MKKFFKKHKKKLGVTAGILLLIIATVIITTRISSQESPQNFYIIEEVSTGDVSSGVSTTGTIVAADRLDLNIYKKNARINQVAITNGQQVTQGQLLFSFDASDLTVGINEAEIAVKEAELAVSEERIRSSQGDSEETRLIRAVADKERAIRDARRDYFFQDAEPTPLNDNMILRPVPVVSGEYNSDEEGSYIVDVYSSNTDSGFSFRYSGLESGVEALYPGRTTALGSRGVYITFSEDIRPTDRWKISLPNVDAPRAQRNREDYRNLMQSLELDLRDTRAELERYRRSNTGDFRSIDLRRAENALTSARRNLSEQYTRLEESRVIAPFSGTIEGVRNVVVGATPTDNQGDMVEFGSLISNEFHITFSLNATEIGSVSLGQKVVATLSLPGREETIEAHIVEIANAPESDYLPQYGVKALISREELDALGIREGMTTNVQIINEEKNDVLRVPTAAIEYRGDQATVLVIPRMSRTEEQILEEFGVLDQQRSAFESYRKTIEVGVVGPLFTEVVSGISEGDFIIVSSSTPSFGGNDFMMMGGSRGGDIYYEEASFEAVELK